MICDERLIEYESIFGIGMHRSQGQWYLGEEQIGTTEEALEFVKRRIDSITQSNDR
jgi:hypothetical protein